MRLTAATLMLWGLAATGARAETLHLGAILPMTGPAAQVGGEAQRGLQFAMDEINAKGGIGGNQVEIIFEDNQAKPDQSVLAFNKLVSVHGVPAVFSALSGPTLAIAPLATRKRVVVVNAGAQADALATASPYLFNTLPTVNEEAKILAKYLVSIGKKTAGILYENAAAGVAGRDGFIQAFTEAGGTVLAQEPSQFGQTDFRPPLLKLAAANPDVVLASITVGHVQLSQQFRQLDLKMPLAGTTLLYNTVMLADPSSNGLLHTQVHIEAPPALAAAYKKRFNEDMPHFAKMYYNAAQVIFQASAKLAAAGKPVTGENLRQTILDTRVFEALVRLDFKNNTASTQIDIKVMRDGTDQLVTSIAGH